MLYNMVQLLSMCFSIAQTFPYKVRPGDGGSEHDSDNEILQRIILHERSINRLECTMCRVQIKRRSLLKCTMPVLYKLKLNGSDEAYLHHFVRYIL